MEVLQKKFEEFQTDLAAHEERVNEVNQFAGKLVQVRAFVRVTEPVPETAFWGGGAGEGRECS